MRRLDPWHVNVGKRVTRSPKIHVRDSGLTHALLDIPDLHALLGHPVVGASYESFAVESLIGAAVDAQPFHYRTARGDEVDLVLVQGGQPRVAIEVKRSSAPTLSAGFHRACDDLEVTERYLVHPSTGSPAYVSSGGVVVIGLGDLVERLRPAS